MSVLLAIEHSALIEWFLTSMWGFPVFIALHSVGMAFVVGLSLIIGLRYLGFVSDISLAIIDKLLRLAWFGFALNFVTGLFLLSSRISSYLFDLVFLVKIALVIVSAIALYLMQKEFRHDTKTTYLRRRYLPALTILGWFGALTAGRWIAYLSGIYA